MADEGVLSRMADTADNVCRIRKWMRKKIEVSQKSQAA
jgi:hypothetical protein